MAMETVITISRQYGSGGRFIGRKLAEALGIPFYDKELITMAAEESGMSKELFEKADEKAGSSLLYTLSMNSYLLHGMAGVPDLPLNDKVFLIQSEMIRKVADKGPCVIVGRCADYVLREKENCLNVYIYSDLDDRVARATTYYGLSPERAREQMQKMDKKRASYYNFYTNLMARENLRDAVGAVEYLKEHAPEDIKRLEEKLDFSVEELGLWREIIEKMYFPYDEKRQVYPMDDGFMMRKPWDENKIPPEKRAWLYENYHPLFIMRHRMSKQADAILGMYLHNDLFTEEEIRRNYDFYQEVTLHHSSLSTCIFGIVACDIGYLDEAYKYFSQSARMDLDDYHNNFYAGIHAANMAGTWQAIVNGFAGVRCQNGVLKFKPTIPKEWEEYAFRLKFKGALLEVRITKDEAEFTLLEGGEISFTVRGKEVVLKSGETYTYQLN